MVGWRGSLVSEKPKVALPFVGEEVVAAMVRKVPERFIELSGHPLKFDPPSLSQKRSVFTEVPLAPLNGRAFDGASRIDVLLRLDESRGLACEVKLGSHRLSKGRVDTEWLRPCEASHEDRRVRGNMMAILDRKFGSLADEGAPLRAQPKDSPSLELDRRWVIVCKREVVDKWAGPHAPAFSEYVRLVAFEDLVAAFGGKSQFNELVAELLIFDYYDKWVRG